MNYLIPQEYELFGLEAETPEPWISAACRLIDAHCRRPGLEPMSHTERLRLLPGSSQVQLTYLPLTPIAPATNAITNAKARFANPRKGEGDGYVAEYANAFQLPGTWADLAIATLDVNLRTGQVTLAQHPLGMAYNEIEINYTAGLATMPDAVKFACAQIVRNAQATPALNVRSGKLDQLRLEYFAEGLVDNSVKRMLAPYVAMRMNG